MEHSSFYGGRKGASFVIVKNFASIYEMATAFRDASYSIVKFDQYVLIDTEDKNNPDNGKVFKRGYGYNSGKTVQWNNPATGKIETIDAGGAQYIGQIGGSSGTTPQLVLTTYTDADSKTGGGSYEERRNSGSYTLANANLVPGKNGTTYNDSIDWVSVSLRQVDGSDATAYIGFKVPYLVNEFITSQVSPYNSSTGAYQDNSSISKVDDGSHPFYNRWRVNIPRGIKGNSLQNLRQMVPVASSVIYTPGTTTQYPEFAQDVANSRQILVYDAYNYDNNQNPSPVTYYLGKVNTITGVTLDDYGTLTVTYNQSSPTVVRNAIKWINGITFNQDSSGQADPGHMIVTYNTLDANNQPEKVEGSFDFVKDIAFANDGTVTVQKVASAGTTHSKLIKWIDSITVNDTLYNAEEGKLTIGYNTGDTFTANLKWVHGLKVESDGKLTLTYAGGGTDRAVKDSNNQDVILRYIDSITLDTTQGGLNEGKITINYNTGETPFTTNLKWVNGIQLANDGTITLKYSGGGTDQVLSTKLKYPTSISISATGIASVGFNDGTSQTLSNAIKYLDNVTLNNGVLRLTYNTETQGAGIKDYDEFSLNYPTDLTIASNGAMVLQYANGTSVSKGTLTMLNNLSVDATTQRLQASYNTGTTQLIGSPLKYIERMAINNTNNHLLVMYNVDKTNMSYGGYTGWTDLGYLFDGVSINNQIQQFAEQDILIATGSNINISRWIGTGYMNNGNYIVSVPLNKIIALSNPTLVLTSGVMTIRYNGNIIVNTSITNSDHMTSKTQTGLLISLGIPTSVYETGVTAPPNNSIVNFDFSNVVIAVSGT